MPTQTRVLLIEDNVLDAQLVKGALLNDAHQGYQLTCVLSLTDAFDFLTKKSLPFSIDIILLALTLVAPSSLSTFTKLSVIAPNSVVVLLCAEHDMALIQQLLNRGAQDYFFKKYIDSYWWPKALSFILKKKSAALSLRASEDALYEEKDRAQITLNSIADAVLTTDLAGKLTYLNLVAEKMTGWLAKEAAGKPLAEVFKVIDGDTRHAVPNPALQVIRENKPLVLPPNSVLIRRDGVEMQVEDSTAPIHNRQGQVTGAVIVFHDVSEMRRLALKMSHLAQHDVLTGLPNRALLNERLTRAIGLAKRNAKKVALLFLDLDCFKTINDSLGHATGDQLLQSVAARLVSCVRGTDTVCRQGGDEFVILLTEIECAEDAAFTAKKLLNAFKLPHAVGASELYVTLSVGISVCPDDGDEAEALMQSADTAMYHAKAMGRNNFQFFKNEMNRRATHRLTVSALLRRALKNNEFVLFYQPKIDLATGNMIGAEALIRWQHPEQGRVYPDQFIRIAEDAGLIVPIGRWVLREACRQINEWLSVGLDLVPIAINISALELRDQHFLSFVANTLQEKKIPPGYLEMEITETILMNDANLSINTLNALKNMGVPLAIDDFGKGYSSLSYLKRFPIDTLKIDQSFIQDMMTDSSDATIVSALIGLGRKLKQTVVAEGVETLEQFQFLRAEDCDQAQGDYFCPPLSAGDFSRKLSPTKQFHSVCAMVPTA